MPHDNRSEKESERRAHVRTRMIHGAARSRRWDYSHHVVPPISSSATFRLDSAERGAKGFIDFAHDTADSHDPIYIYDRLEEPTRGMLEDNLATAEGGDAALCFASGMAAISAAVGSILRSGDEMVAHHVLYGCTYSLFTNWLPRFGITVRFVDVNNASALRDAMRPRTRAVYFETPVNPDMTLIDIGAVRQAVDEINGIRPDSEKSWIIVDNTFATPVCQRPISLGADIVCHSLTKGIGGFGADVGGAVIAPKSLRNQLLMYRKDFGGILSPKAAWATLVYGLPTLATRMANYQKTAHHVARHLCGHPKVELVRYPGLDSFPQYELAKRQMCDPKGRFAPGSMLYFVLKDGGTGTSVGERFVDHIAQHSYAISLAVSLGQIKTLIECPFSMTHAAVPHEEMIRRGVVPGGIRLSCGLEDWEDLVSDLEEALDAV
ncbi:MAG: PLP-dependent aspartate aminotransferase family protein [Planctomycetota bacterium]